MLFAAGCAAKCRELEPVSEIRENLREQVDDRLTEVDVSDAQRAKIQARFARALPARMQFRKETVPLLHQLVSELRRNTPDRQAQAAVISKLVDSGERYGHVIAEIMLESHGELTPVQRKRMAVKAAEPSPAFENSWLLDRGIDLLMLRIHANDAQAALVDRMKQHFVQQARALQRRLDFFRAEAAAEFLKDKPEPVRIHATLKRARGEAQRFMLEVVGYQQLLASKLDPDQRARLNAELVRIEACPDSAKPAGTALQSGCESADSCCGCGLNGPPAPYLRSSTASTAAHMSGGGVGQLATNTQSPPVRLGSGISDRCRGER